jgi:hypothetical protein
MRNNADYPVSQVGSNDESPPKHARVIHHIAPGDRRETMSGKSENRIDRQGEYRFR